MSAENNARRRTATSRSATEYPLIAAQAGIQKINSTEQEANWFRKERKFSRRPLGCGPAGRPQASFLSNLSLEDHLASAKLFSSDRERPMAARRCPGVERGWFDSPWRWLVLPHLSQQCGIVRGGKAVGLVCLFAGGLAIFSSRAIAGGDPKPLEDDCGGDPQSSTANSAIKSSRIYTARTGCGLSMRSRDDRE
jgi:hypothetical protein